MRKQWRMCLERDCLTVIGCNQETEYDWKTYTCVTCVDNNCPEEGSDISHGLCEFCKNRALKRIKERRENAKG